MEALVAEKYEKDVHDLVDKVYNEINRQPLVGFPPSRSAGSGTPAAQSAPATRIRRHAPSRGAPWNDSLDRVPLDGHVDVGALRGRLGHDAEYGARR